MRGALLAVLLLLPGCPGPDNAPPSVAILTPADNDTVRGIITVRARARDNDRVTAVELLVDAGYYATDSTGRADTFGFSLNAAALALDTIHALSCVAFDASGNSDTSKPVQVFVWPGTRHTGAISSDETWTPAGNPHFVEGELVIRARLFIKPGVEVQFMKDAGISLTGTSPRLLAEGTRDSGVVFTARSLAPAPGDWRGIDVLAGTSQDTSILRYCAVGYGGGGGTGLLYANAGAVVVESCALGHSKANGVVIDEGNLVRFSGNAVSDCAGFPLLLAPAFVQQVIPGNRYSGNQHNGVGIAAGTVTVSARWENQGVPYYLAGTMDVAGPADPVLTIAPGCSLLFPADAALRVGIGQPGGLIADGSTGSISFGFFESAPGTRYWRGIELWDQTDPFRTEFRACVIDHAGGNGVAAVLCYQPVAISGTTVRNSSSAGVRCFGSGFGQFTDNTVTSCAGYPIQLEAAGAGTLGGGNRFAGNASDSIAVNAGRIAGDSRWRNHGIPYLVDGSIEVGAMTMPQLTVDPGVTIAFGPAGALVVGRDYAGDLIAAGVPDSITFTATRPAPGAWNGVQCCEHTGGRTVLDHCRMFYGGADGRGILYIERCAPEVTGCEIACSSNYCIFLNESWLDPDQLRLDNWLHDWDPDYDDIYE